MTTHPRKTTSRIRIGSRLAVGAGAAALCLGISVPAAAPAAAHNTGTSPVTHGWQFSLAEQKTWFDHALAAEATWLQNARTKVQDSSLPADKKAEITTRIDNALTAIDAARSAVASASTEGDLHTALAQAWPAWGALFAADAWHHDRGMHRHHWDARADHHADHRANARGHSDVAAATITRKDRTHHFSADSRRCDHSAGFASAYQGRHRWDGRHDPYRSGYHDRYGSWDSHRDGGYRGNSGGGYSGSPDRYSGHHSSYGGYSGGHSSYGGWNHH